MKTGENITILAKKEFNQKAACATKGVVDRGKKAGVDPLICALLGAIVSDAMGELSDSIFERSGK